MKKTLRYLKKYKKEVVLGPLFKLIEATFELFIPLVVASIIDDGIGKGDTPLVIKSSLLMIALGVLGLLFSVTAQYFCAKAATGFGADVRLALFEKINTFSYSQIDRFTTSTLITRLTSDTTSMQNGVNLVLRLVLRSPFIVLGAAVMAFFVDPKGALWFVMVIPLLSLIIFGIMAITVPLHKAVQKKVDTILSLSEENISGARVIRAFAAEESEEKRFTEENRALYSLQKKAGRFSALMNPVTYVVINAATVALLWTGAVRVDEGMIKVGAVVALFNYMSQILIELIKFATVIVSVTKAKASADRVETVLFAPDEPSPASSEQVYGSKVVFDDVTFTYPQGSAPSVEGLSFSCEAGETVGIIGGTGSGKTTLINLLCGFYTPDSGTVAVNGRDVLSHDRSSLLSKIALVPQKAVLFSGTVRDNLLFGNEKADDERLLLALKTALADDFVDQKGGLDAKITQNAKNLSGGQRQRLAIARALVKDSEILILDDSSSALDLATDAQLRRNFRQMKDRPLTFIVSQRTSSIMYADKIIVLDDGRCVGIGRHEELLCNCSVYREIYETQFKAGGEE